MAPEPPQNRVDLVCVAPDGTEFRLKQVGAQCPVARIKAKLLPRMREALPLGAPPLESPADVVLLRRDTGHPAADTAHVSELGGRVDLLTADEWRRRVATPAGQGRGGSGGAVPDVRVTVVVENHLPARQPPEFRLRGIAPHKCTFGKVLRLVARHLSSSDSPDALALHWRGSRVAEEDTLASAGIFGDARIELLPAQQAAPAPMRITVQGMDGRTVSARLPGDARVSELHAEVYEAWGAPAPLQRLILRGQPLADPAALLSAVGVYDGATVHCVLRAGSPPARDSPAGAQPGHVSSQGEPPPPSSPASTARGAAHAAAAASSRGSDDPLRATAPVGQLPGVGRPRSGPPLSAHSESVASHQASGCAAAPAPPLHSHLPPPPPPRPSAPPITLSVLSAWDQREYRLPGMPPDAVTVGRVKELLEAVSGLPCCEQMLSRPDGTLLNSAQTLADAGLCGGEGGATLVHLTTRSALPPPPPLGPQRHRGPAASPSARQHPPLSPSPSALRQQPPPQWGAPRGGSAFAPHRPSPEAPQPPPLVSPAHSPSRWGAWPGAGAGADAAELLRLREEAAARVAELDQQMLDEYSRRCEAAAELEPQVREILVRRSVATAPGQPPFPYGSGLAAVPYAGADAASSTQSDVMGRHLQRHSMAVAAAGGRHPSLPPRQLHSPGKQRAPPGGGPFLESVLCDTEDAEVFATPVMRSASRCDD
eukprot:TRINITY_DN4714_c0_g1_i1.p1 TRINITY_DN4714_c0_g1~~TRINITY_DN4714_c0_g1_i1.p1  ORF type:complete len:710 (+),score=129.14 TRINITY_DN4714_c0_g1_i1:92-2221(+)